MLKPRYRGDSFDFIFVTPENTIIEAGSIIKIAVRSTGTACSCALYSEYVTKSDTNELYASFSAEETAKLQPSASLEETGEEYILEVEIKYPDGFVITAFQEKIEILEDYII